MQSTRIWVSVLFSEPKIPQEALLYKALRLQSRFSALQRAENSSIQLAQRVANVGEYSFSALQRAENSSIKPPPTCLARRGGRFQCSSASRKFLNNVRGIGQAADAQRFQCSSASRKFLNCGVSAARSGSAAVSVLFSEPKIPQYTLRCSAER